MSLSRAVVGLAPAGLGPALLLLVGRSMVLALMCRVLLELALDTALMGVTLWAVGSCGRSFLSTKEFLRGLVKPFNWQQMMLVVFRYVFLSTF